MKINNLKIEVRICKSFISKAAGLMFASKPRNLLFVFDKESWQPLHMFFVFFPIDVALLDRNKKIVEIKENFRPFTLYNPKHKTKYILEMPKGSVKRYRIKVGKKIKFKNK